MIKRVKLSPGQLSFVEIHVVDAAHDDERESWWPQLDEKHLVFDTEHADRLYTFFTDLANGASEGPGGNGRTGRWEDEGAKADYTAASQLAQKMLSATTVTAMGRVAK